MATFPSLILLQGDPSSWSNPPAGKTAIGINSLGQIVLRQSDGTLQILASPNPSINDQTIAGTNIVISPETPIDTQKVTVTGAAREIAVLLDEAGISEGSQLRIVFRLPAVADMTLNIFSGATQIAQFVNDGSVLAMTVEVYFLDGGWEPLRIEAPSFTPFS